MLIHKKAWPPWAGLVFTIWLQLQTTIHSIVFSKTSTQNYSGFQKINTPNTIYGMKGLNVYETLSNVRKKVTFHIRKIKLVECNPYYCNQADQNPAQEYNYFRKVVYKHVHQVDRSCSVIFLIHKHFSFKTYTDGKQPIV